MAKLKACIVGAGRIGAGFKWDQDLGYTHAGAYLALKDRVELLGFVEPDRERADAASAQWNLPCFKSIDGLGADIVSVCTRDDDHHKTYMSLNLTGIKGIWMEKPFYGHAQGYNIPIQVNYQRRGDPFHREVAKNAGTYADLIVYGKDDRTTRCHFEDLSRWWQVKLDYRIYDGPCAYLLRMAVQTGPVWSAENTAWFDGGVGGVDSAVAFRNMLTNLLDHIDNGTELWSPPYLENQ